MTAGTAAAPGLEIRRSSARDPLARPLLEDLEREYDRRYGVAVFGEPASVELNRYAPELFEAPRGAFLLLLEGEEPVSGGAFMPFDAETAEVKRVWTRADRRGRGLAGRVLAALEAEALALGYSRIFLTTGPRQPEAVALYLRAGYTPLYDRALPPEAVGVHPFEKRLAPQADPDPDPAASTGHRPAPDKDPVP